MTGPQSEQQWRWAEALAFEKLWGEHAALRLAERIGVLALRDEQAGIERMQEIARCLDQILIERATRGQ